MKLSRHIFLIGVASVFYGFFSAAAFAQSPSSTTPEYASVPSAANVPGSRAFLFKENDNDLIELQQNGGDPSTEGNVKIEFYGHDAFKVTSPKGLTILVDPWRNDPSGLFGKWFLHEFPEIPVDIAISTHAHFDHDGTQRPHALTVLDRLVGDIRLSDVEITGLADKHQCASSVHHKWDQIEVQAHFSTCPPNNPLSFDNAIEIVKTGGLRIVFWGDNRPTPNPALDQYLKNADVMILPIDDSQTLLTTQEAEAIISRYTPKAVIPAHYLVKGLLLEASGFKAADAWVQTQSDVRRIGNGEMVFNTAELTGAHRRVYYFGLAYKSK